MLGFFHEIIIDHHIQLIFFGRFIEQHKSNMKLGILGKYFSSKIWAKIDLGMPSHPNLCLVVSNSPIFWIKIFNNFVIQTANNSNNKCQRIPMRLTCSSYLEIACSHIGADKHHKDYLTIAIRIVENLNLPFPSFDICCILL